MSTKYSVTQHAIQRYADRVSVKGLNREDFPKRVEDWCNTAIKDGKSLGDQPNGTTWYRFTEHIVVVNESQKRVVTIVPAEDYVDTNDSIFGEIESVVLRTLRRVVRPSLERKHELMSELHKLELNRLRVHNPNTKMIIGEKITKVEAELDEISKRIVSCTSIAHQYKVKLFD